MKKLETNYVPLRRSNNIAIKKTSFSEVTLNDKIGKVINEIR